MNNAYKKSFSDITLDTIIIVVLSAFTIVAFYPLYFVVIASFTRNSVVEASAGVLLWPVGFNTGAFRLTLNHPLIYRGYVNIFRILGMALPLNFILTMFCAYFMAAKNMLFKVPVILLMTFTMFFSGGLVPIYLNIRWLGIYNSHWALVLPFAMSLFNAIITKTAIDGLPDSLTESAYIDGANDLTILFRIVIPLIIPTVAVIMLYYTVGHWNSWFAASIFIQDQRKMPLQVILRSILIQNIDMFGDRTQTDQTIRQRYTETIKYAVIVMSTAPILLVYPFIQRYFVKGVMIGAIKG